MIKQNNERSATFLANMFSANMCVNSSARLAVFSKENNIFNRYIL